MWGQARAKIHFIMLLFQLFANNPLLIFPWAAALLIAITVHEFSHGFSAHLLGDDTAKEEGRLTLNPTAHLDLFGSLMLVLVGFGWAKPVPINPARVGRGNLGQFLVSFAGVLSNITIAVLCAVVLKILIAFGGLDQMNFLVKFLAFLIYIDLALFVFNLLPIAPLDGYRVFESIAPKAFRAYAPFLERWGFFILLFLVFFTGIIGFLISLFINLFSLLFGLNIYWLAFGGL